MNKIAIIAAMDSTRVIGKDNKLPAWEAPGDLRRFRQLTEGKVVVMGRKTFESIGKPLPKRLNVVVSKTLSSQPGFYWTYPTLETALAEAKKLAEVEKYNTQEIMIIGGAKVYEEALEKHFVDQMHLTMVKGEHPGDTWFPLIDLKEWKVLEKEDFSTHSFVTFTKVC